MTTNTKKLKLLKHKSAKVSLGPDRAPARSMLRAVGLTDEDMEKPFIAVANLASDVTPCNVHLTRIADKVKEGIRDA
ncbi:MAG: dihydroxy-acid dehydratase [Chloroflexi bacterium]|nr:MAG: dihydroxy-acid dehydratase [Chloroflexota bacterium]